MKRGKRVIEKIENRSSRAITLWKRRGGLFKKASELSVLCDAQIGIIIFSSSGKPYQFCTEPFRIEQIIERYQLVKARDVLQSEVEIKTEVVEEDTLQVMHNELAKLRSNTRDLEPSLWRYMGKDLSSMEYEELLEHEQQLEYTVKKVRAQKDQLLKQQLKDLQRKERMLEKENARFSCQIQEGGKVASAQQEAGAHPVLFGQQEVLNQFPFNGEEQHDIVLQLANLLSHHFHSFQADQQD